MNGVMADKPKKKFQVDTPQKTPEKQEKKYGWMKEQQQKAIDDVWSPKQNILAGAKLWIPETKNKFVPKVLDAIFIAPNLPQARYWAKQLNYKPGNCLLLWPFNYVRSLNGIEPDEDLIVHLCGSWVADITDEGQYQQLLEVRKYLKHRGFTYEEVPEIGKTNPSS
jgi:hypothetical protein